MVIALEAGLNIESMRGIDYYIANVIEALSEVDAKNRYIVFSYFYRDYERKRIRLPQPRKPNFELCARRWPERLVHALEYGWGLPLIESLGLAGQDVAVYHAVGGGRLPHLRRAKGVVTFFDLSNEAFPKEGLPDPGKRISDPFTCDVARRADAIIATGDYTKRDLIRYYAIPDEKIEVIPTGVNIKVFRPVEDTGELKRIRERYALPESYFMLIGPYVPPRRTNAETTLKAFAEMKGAGETAGHKLVFVGSRGPELEGLLSRAGELGLGQDVHATGYVALDELPVLYGLSTAVVHPTSVEGFGYGLEVLASGATFVTSDLPGVLEAVGDAALTVPPKNAARLREAMRSVIAKPDVRRDLRRKGLERSARFAYPKIAERIMAVYERLGAGRE